MSGDQVWRNSYVRKLVKAHFTDWTLTSVAMRGAMFVLLEWGTPELYINPAVFIEDAGCWAVRMGHLHVLKWLQKHGPPMRITQLAMDTAAAKGHVHVLEWVYANRQERCSWRALAWALQNNRHAVVQWVYNEGQLLQLQ